MSKSAFVEGVERLRLPPISIHRWIAEWFNCNFAAASFRRKQLCSRFYSIEVEFHLQKRQIRFFEPPFGELEVTYVLQL